MIVGLDEVGRGCWAGPLVAGAVLLQTPIAGLKDSKLLSRKQREHLDGEIRIQAVGFGLGWVSAAEIDEMGLTAAVRVAMERALAGITAPFERIIIDGNFNFFQHLPNSEAIIGADNKIPAVSAASIIAKVARDHFMARMANRFPGYHFDKHVGYGTAAHRAALKAQGICELHRRCFRPVQAFV